MLIPLQRNSLRAVPWRPATSVLLHSFLLILFLLCIFQDGVILSRLTFNLKKKKIPFFVYVFIDWERERERERTTEQRWPGCLLLI